VDKRTLLFELNQTRSTWDKTLERISQLRMVEPGVVPEWTVKDIIAHVSWGERETVGMLEAKALVGSELWLVSVEQRNTAVYEQNRNRVLVDIYADSEAIHLRLIEIVEGTSEDDLSHAEWFSDLPGGNWPPHRVIQVNVIDHYQHHTQDIENWLEG
jgi:hypothetical protein